MKIPNPLRAIRPRHRWKVITAAVAVILASVLGVGVAFAADNHGAMGTTFVDGGSVLTDDWGDHYGELGHPLCDGCADSRNTDLVVMWQAILYAEGFLSCPAIDGWFGSGTAAATKKWQSRYSLTADGIVGGATWAKADNNLVWAADTPGNWPGSAVFYMSGESNGRIVMFTRGGEDWYRDDGAYSLDAATQNKWITQGAFNSSSNRIQFKQRTITVGCS